MVRPWDLLLSDDDRKVLKLGGYGRTSGLGVRPVVVVIDVQYFMVGEDAPIHEQIRRFPSGCGQRAWRAVRESTGLLTSAREAGVPIVYIRTVLPPGSSWLSVKTNRDMTRYESGPDTEIVSEVAPEDGDVIVQKAFPDAFLGTTLQAHLINLRADTLILIGGSVSGCVRATATTAASLNYRVSVVEDCVFDRLDVSHRIGLMEIWRSLGDIPRKADIQDYFRRISDNAKGSQ